ncbi:MAG: TetR/AcrR family transcriptional regulator [Rhodobacteraceae bacterium]|nr:TetR/AcrR family transcriptional regulator [Paracoccaceae bacterium]
MATERAAARKPSIRKRNDEIFDAAARVFAERGYHGASTQDIADLLGMRQASLYYYFSSKEAALEEVCAIGAAGFVENAEEIAANDAGPTEKLRALASVHITPLAERPDFTRTFLNERKWLPTESRRRIGGMSRRIEAIFEGVIRAGMRQGEFRSDLNVRLTMFGILGMVNSVQIWLDRANKTPSEIAEYLADMAVASVRAVDPPEPEKNI